MSKQLTKRCEQQQQQQQQQHRVSLCAVAAVARRRACQDHSEQAKACQLGKKSQDNKNLQHAMEHGTRKENVCVKEQCLRTYI